MLLGGGLFLKCIQSKIIVKFCVNEEFNCIHLSIFILVKSTGN